MCHRRSGRSRQQLHVGYARYHLRNWAVVCVPTLGGRRLWGQSWDFIIPRCKTSSLQTPHLGPAVLWGRRKPSSTLGPTRTSRVKGVQDGCQRFWKDEIKPLLFTSFHQLETLCCVSYVHRVIRG